MNRRPLGTAAVVVGAVLVLLALLADTLGIGGQPGFGWKQAVGLGGGVVLAAVGAAMLAGLLKPAGGETGAPPSRAEDPPPPE